MSIREEILEEHKKNWKEMTPEQRIKHFWHYYKIHVAVAVAIIAFIVYLILRATVFAPLPYGFAGYALSSNYYMATDLSAVDNFINDFAVREGINTEEYQIMFDVSNAMNPDSTNTLDMAVDLKLVTAGQDGELDVLIGNSKQIDFYVINGFYDIALDELMPEDMFKEYDEAGLIYYYYDETMEETYPIGVYISDAPRIKELELYNGNDEIILGVICTSPRTDTAIDFIEYIYETP